MTGEVTVPPVVCGILAEQLINKRINMCQVTCRRLVEDAVSSGDRHSAMSRHTHVTQRLVTVHTPTPGQGGVTAVTLRRQDGVQVR